MTKVFSALGALAIVTVCALGAGACSSPEISSAPGTVVAVGAENQYANVISQVGGVYVQAHAILSNPDTDPHTFEASPSVAHTVGAARLVVENGLGYDSWMDKLMSASPLPGRQVINVQQLIDKPDNTPNPHLWYDPATMPAVAQAVAADLSILLPAHSAYFQSRAATFVNSLATWDNTIAQIKSHFAGTAVATTEPVADYMLDAAGLVNATPFTFQLDVMNGTDPSPQDVTVEKDLLSSHRVKVFVYNEQVTDSLTSSLASLAKSSGVPVVGVYETMPTGYDYQTWMEAEAEAVLGALANGKSTTSLR